MRPVTKRILFLSFFYPPDLSAGSFRSAALVKALRSQGGDRVHLDVVTTRPNRYNTFKREADSSEQHDGLHIRRIVLPKNKGGLLGQAWSFLYFAIVAFRFARARKYDAVFATSSRLMTAVLGAFIAACKGVQLYLDIRDIFVETLAGVFNATVWRPVVWLFSMLERWVIRRATIVNLVSPGFLPYFQSRYPDGRFSLFSNGVDADFIEPLGCTDKGRVKGEPLRVLYAGNIGDGQGLHLILPALAEQLRGRVRFQVIGDGRHFSSLRDALSLRQLDNVELLAPVPRQQIKLFYEQADVLFLHLNDLQAFKRVLPSKLFEYAASGKPIWAGVSGFSTDFISKEVANAAVFPSCDVACAIEAFEAVHLASVDRRQFVERYGRERIMGEMAREIMAMAGST
ncbi:MULTISPECIES: glycosyltransferase family 4 protein [unclassified Pseudomonas]|uniref:glycosyltransferase family 4 protein n=1 Tax=unclassified Pseudomonas TaxID=196821 RepID=UPI00339AB196